MCPLCNTPITGDPPSLPAYLTAAAILQGLQIPVFVHAACYEKAAMAVVDAAVSGQLRSRG